MSSTHTTLMDAVTTSSSRRHERSFNYQRAFSILLFVVFVVVDLLALVIGTSSYGSLTKMQAANDARIMTLGPITSSIRANDAADSIRTGEGPEGKALVLATSDEAGTYETRIYLYEGNIMQEYALADAPYAPQKATALSPSSEFDFFYDDGVLTVTTEAGSAKVALRNLQGGA